MARQRVSFRAALRIAGRTYEGFETDATGITGPIVLFLHAVWWWIVGVPVRERKPAPGPGWKVSVDGVDTESLDDRNAHALCASAIAAGAQELWISTEWREPALCLLMNRERCFAMWLAENGDPGWTSLDQASEGTEAFLLSNGQGDEYPRRWTVPKSFALTIALDFLASQGRSSAITWRDGLEA